MHLGWFKGFFLVCLGFVYGHCLGTRCFEPNILIRSHRKVSSNPKASKASSSKRLHSIAALTSMKCAGSRHDQMEVNRCMAQKSFCKSKGGFRVGFGSILFFQVIRRPWPGRRLGSPFVWTSALPSHCS